MSDTIRLKHLNRSSLRLRVQHFYDGQARVEYGVITLPTNKPAWIDRCFMLGYRVDPESGKTLELLEIRARAAGQTPPPETEKASAESVGEDIEGTDIGGQPSSDDGLRESEPRSDEGVPEPEVDSSVSDRADDGEEGNGPTA